MSIAEDIKQKLNNNQHTAYIIEADELLAVLHYLRNPKRPKGSVPYSNIPQECRLSAPPNDDSPTIPCHISHERKTGRLLYILNNSTSSCHGHGHGNKPNISLSDLMNLDNVSFARRNVAPYVSPILDTAALAFVTRELGVSGRAIPKVINGRQYIALSGFPGLRNRLPGTIYKANNRRIVNLAIGTLGLNRMVRNGGLITIGVTVPLTVIEVFLRDNSSRHQLFGNLASELLKIGVPTLAGWLAGTGLAMTGVPVVATIGFTIVVGFAVQKGVDRLDKQYGLTEKLIVTLEDLSEKMDKVEDEVGSVFYRGAEGFLRSQGYRGPL